MNTWQLAAGTEEYQQALTATATLVKDQRPAGFVEPHTWPSNLGEANIQRQNNAQIHLLVQILERLKELDEKVQVLSDRVSALERNKGHVALPDDAIAQLTEQLRSTSLSSTGAGRPVIKANKGTFRVWK
uniref:Uncharacterized protein n=1 Tax=Green Sichuan pepper vein clearing-associated virus TaxID=2802539 RepID=A0A513Q1E0_9VIRU|nr:hypothetical protein 2 [Green Sichuan pepper vein clearing-associated virus]